MKMPVKSKQVVYTPYDLFMMLRSFILGEIAGLDEDCTLVEGITAKGLQDAVDSLQYYLALAQRPQILPLNYEVIDDEKFNEEYEKQCQK